MELQNVLGVLPFSNIAFLLLRVVVALVNLRLNVAVEVGRGYVRRSLVVLAQLLLVDFAQVVLLVLMVELRWPLTLIVHLVRGGENYVLDSLGRCQV